MAELKIFSEKAGKTTVPETLIAIIKTARKYLEEARKCLLTGCSARGAIGPPRQDKGDI
jgi:hypothetical protein